MQPRLVEYLENPPSESEIDSVLKKLGMTPEALARQKEPVYQQKAEGRALSRADWLRLFHENPELIERPILVMGDQAWVVRPAEQLDEILPLKTR
jgi:arsenate reductase